MLVYKNYLLKKTTIIFEIILIIVFICLSLFMSYRKSLFINYDNIHSDTYIDIYSDKDIKPLLDDYDNTRYITNVDEKVFDYEYTYRLYLKHYYKYFDGLRDFISFIKDKGINVRYLIHEGEHSYEDFGETVDSTNSIMKVLIFVVVIIIIIVISNVISDEKKSNRLQSYLGFTQLKLFIINTNKALMLLIIPIIMYFVSHYVILLLLT